MFGTILADKNNLTEEQALRYKACYCGLCCRIHEKYGTVARMTLQYDMVFLILLLSSLYEPEETHRDEHCVMHPLKKHPSIQTGFTDYAAAMNVALAYYKCMDDWHDDKSLLHRGEASLLKKAMETIRQEYPEKCAVMEAQLRALATLEQAGRNDPDQAASCFGKLTGELFAAVPGDRWNNALRALGDSLGRFIYLSDALLDLKKDRKKGRYNPLDGHVDPENADAFLLK